MGKSSHLLCRIFPPQSGFYFVKTFVSEKTFSNINAFAKKKHFDNLCENMVRAVSEEAKDLGGGSDMLIVGNCEVTKGFPFVNRPFFTSGIYT